MTGEVGAPSRFPRAARVLKERFGEIFEDYERRLTDARSLLVVGEGNTRAQLKANARSVLTRAAKVLRGEEPSLLAVEEEIYRNIEASEEPLNPHPDESLRAGVALCKAAVSVVVRNMPPESLSSQEVAEVSLAVQEIVLDRVTRMIMASYVDYLLTKVNETRSEERRRFARELHDRLAHQMVAVTQNLDLYEALKERDPANARGRLRHARGLVETTVELMREFSGELRGSEASEGLRLALENLMSISVPPEVGREVSFHGDEAHMPEYVRDQLYLILREGIRNVMAHSGSDSITVEVDVTPAEVTAAILDRGSGFELESPPTEGVGLHSMRERAELLGGSFALTSEPGGGTRVEVSLPLMRAGDAPHPPEGM